MAWLPPALARGFAPEPSDYPPHIHGGGIEPLLEVRAREADVPTPAEVEAPDPLRQAALHLGSQRILGFELRRLPALPCSLERLMVGLQPNGELAMTQAYRL
jgi:hypothetical protein